MNADNGIQKSRRSVEITKWIIVVLLLLMAIVWNFFYQNVMLILRVIIVMIFIAAAFGVILLTTKGKEVIDFSREARMEVRKVIWPTREETLHTTLIIMLVTAVMSLILWGLDSIFVRLISFIVGLRF